MLCLPVFSCVQFAGWQPLHDSTSVVNLVRDGRRVYKALTGNKSSLCCFAVTTVVSGSPSPGVFFFAPSCIGARYNIKWRRGKTASSSRCTPALIAQKLHQAQGCELELRRPIQQSPSFATPLRQVRHRSAAVSPATLFTPAPHSTPVSHGCLIQLQPAASSVSCYAGSCISTVETMEACVSQLLGGYRRRGPHAATQKSYPTECTRLGGAANILQFGATYCVGAHQRTYED